MFDMFNIQARFTPELYERKGKRDLFINWDAVTAYAPESFLLRNVSVSVADITRANVIAFAPESFLLQTYGRPLVASISHASFVSLQTESFNLRTVVVPTGSFSAGGTSVNYSPVSFTLEVVVVNLNSYTDAASIGYVPASFVLA